MSDDAKKIFMERAIELSQKSIENGGGPFAAVIVKNGEIIGEGANEVTKSNDPTAHGEMVAIRNACKNINSFNLQGCEIYTSCEPCPMCLSAIMWARISKIYYANNQKDAAQVGFDDAYFYEQISMPMKERDIPFFQMMEKQAKKVFDNWSNKTDKVKY